MEDYITPQHRYYSLDFYLKKRFGKKVFKVALNGGFSCPNRDGTISKMGCIFCSEQGSGEFAGNIQDPLPLQFQEIQSMIHKKWPDAYYIAYFQAFTNTYGPVSRLKELFEEAITLHPNIVAISIATRPDCLPIEILDYLGELNTRIPVWVELGLQTIHEKTAEKINRGYPLDVFKKTVDELSKRNIETIVHIINGLPGETKEMMIETIRCLSKLPIQGIKFHSLFILKNTSLGSSYQKQPFPLLSLEEYVDIVVEQLAHLRKDIVVHRVNGDAPPENLLTPFWTTKKFIIMNEIDKKMKLLHIVQGSLQ